MRRTLRTAMAMGLVASVVGCHGIGQRTSSLGNDRARSQAGIVLDADQFTDRAGSFLNILSGRLAGLQVRRSNAICPEVIVRGRKSILGSNDPAVYVDGVRMSNTCILDGINPSEVRRVEFYPIGIAPNPQYRGHPNGLILVFMQSGPTE